MCAKTHQKKPEDWIEAGEALELLSVKPQTLYAYVSRGLVRAQADPDDRRRSLYARHDIRHLVERRKRPRRRADVAAGTIAWGEPVLESSLSTARGGELFFGNRSAVSLADFMTLEQAAAHHWRAGYTRPEPMARTLQQGRPDSSLAAKCRGFMYLAARAGDAPPSHGRTRAALALEASSILSGFAGALTGCHTSSEIHSRFAQAWGLDASGADLVRRALVLISDHELNASTFAVRVAASTGASLGASVLAGYAALTGPLHGEAGAAARRVLETAMETGSPAQAVSAALSGNALEYGFGHTLYPDGDSRARSLFSAMPLGSVLKDHIGGCEAIIGKKANIDMALAALAITFSLPREAAFMIFAVGRMAGWLGHAIEQCETGQLIRPRARFVPPLDSQASR